MTDRRSSVAIIDLGTNTFHLLFAEWNGQQYGITYRERAAATQRRGSVNLRQVATSRVVHI